MIRRFTGAALALALLALAGCQTPVRQAARVGVSVQVEQPAEWVRAAAPEDVQKIERLPMAWSEALAEARRGGFSRQIRAEGALLEPGAGLPRAAPPPGSYNCRLIRLGSLNSRDRAFVSHKPFFCFVGVNDDQLSITKQTGSLRPGGYLWDTESTKRLIFLGSVALGNEEGPLAYGEDKARNMAGVFERYGNLRYRLLVPWPGRESKLDVFELIPTTEQPEN
jgi:hypothetical protein